MTEKPKRGPGRPPTLPPGPRYRLRCDVVGDEIELVRAAAASLGISQQDFTRRAVLELVARATPAPRGGR